MADAPTSTFVVGDDAEARLRRVIAASGLGYWDWNVATGEAVFAGGWQTMLGFGEGELPATFAAWERLLQPDDQARVLAAWRALLAGERSTLAEKHRMRTRDGWWRWVLTEGRVVSRQPDGLPLHVAGTQRDVHEHEEAVASLRLFRALSDRVNDGIEIIDPETGRFVDMNETGCRQLGYTRAEILALTVPDIDPLVDAAAFRANAARMRDAGTVTIDSVHRRKDGTTFPVEISFSHVRLEREFMVAVVRDISVQQQAAAALREREALLTSINAHLPGACVYRMAYEPTGAMECLYVSPAVERLIGMPAERFRRAPADIFELVHADDRGVFRATLAAALRSGGATDLTVRVRGADGAWRWMAFRSHLLERRPDGTQVRDGVVVEVTAIKTAEAEVRTLNANLERVVAERTAGLRESEEKFRGVFDHSPVAIGLLTVPEGRFVEFNDACLGMFGYSRAEALGRTSVEMGLWADPAERERYLTLLRVHGAVTGFEARMRRKDGAIRDVLYTGNFITLGGRPYSLNSLQDITARKQAEARVADSLREKETLLREIHHRVKNNLQVIGSLLYFQTKRALGERERAVFADGENRLRAMILVHEKLYRSPDLHRINVGDYVRALAEQLHQTFRGADRIALRVEADELFATAEIALPCGMIVTELVTNAGKHAFPGEARGTITVRLARGAAGFRLSVGDDGAGLPADFDPGRATTFGLQLVHNLAAQIDATFVRAPGPGAAFALEVPLALAPGPDAGLLSATART
jgi:PAS domain S-box-containing protein